MWRLGKRFTIVKCPGGPDRRVYEDINDVFPLYLKDIKDSREASVNAAHHVQGKLKADYQEKVSTLIFHIDQKNAGAQPLLRAAYAAYMLSPCTELEYLKSVIDEISYRDHALRTCEVVLTQLQALLKLKNLDQTERVIEEYLTRAMEVLIQPKTSTLLADKMGQVGANTSAWRNP